MTGNASPDAVRIVQVSDTHLSRNRAYFQTNWESFLDLVGALRPDLVVHSGDLCLAGNEDADDLVFGRDQMARLPVPWRIIPGNHDIGDTPPDEKRGHALTTDRRARWLELFGPDWWEERLGGWRIIGINAQLMGSGLDGEEEQWQWLAGALERDGEGPVLLFSHKAPFFSDPEDLAFTNSALRPAPRARLLELMRAADVRWFACGHNHVYQTARHNGTRYLWAPSTSFVHRLPKPGAKRSARRITGFMQYRLAGARLTYECIEPPEFMRYDVTAWQRANGTTSRLPPMPLGALGGRQP
jgi:3',5'-cyclic AMP phosphodiesterase CpdA